MSRHDRNTTHRRAARIRRGFARIGLLVAATLVVGGGSAQASDRTASFHPVRTTDNALIFRLKGVKPARVVEARAKLHPKHGAHRKLERNVSVRRVRSAASHKRLLRVSKPGFIGGGRLSVKLTSRRPTRPPQPAPAPSSGGCVLDRATITVSGCNLLRSDTASAADPEAGLWGHLDCESDSRYQYLTGGADANPTASGSAQGNNAFRRLTAIDGDDYWGERCELGRNEHRNGENTGSRDSGTFALYRDGEHKVTFFSERYQAGFADPNAWQTVAQMKQTQPADYAGLGPVLELQIFDGRLRLQNSWHERWTTPAPAEGVWIRYALDVVYSADPAVGSVQVTVDLNGDGDALDAGEQSPRINMQTLLVETEGSHGASDGFAAGDSISDHLRLGLYHNPSFSCPPPGGCSVDVDNVQVAG
jgi:hypothetical protein